VCFWGAGGDRGAAGAQEHPGDHFWGDNNNNDDDNDNNIIIDVIYIDDDRYIVYIFDYVMCYVQIQKYQ